MRVYLDTAHLAELDRLRHADAPRARAFVRMWRGAGAVLIISGAHIQEVGQLATQRSVRSRLAAISSLGRVDGMRSERHSYVDELVHQELMAEVLDLALPAFNAASARRAVVREIIFKPIRIRHVRDYLQQEQSARVAEMRKFIGWMSEADLPLKERLFAPRPARPSGGGRRTSTASRPSTPPITRRLPPTGAMHGPRTAEKWAEERVARDAEHHGRCSRLTASLRDNLLCVGLLYDWRHIAKAPTEDLLDMGHIARTLRNRTLSEVDRYLSMIGLPIPTGLFETVVDPYALPGVSLRFAVERARRRATRGRVGEQSDVLDADHVMFAPYVDLAFVDRRTYGYVESERKARPHLIAPGADSSLRFAPDLARVESAITDLYSALKHHRSPVSSQSPNGTERSRSRI